jgi:hypothetical protein
MRALPRVLLLLLWRARAVPRWPLLHALFLRRHTLPLGYL